MKQLCSRPFFILRHGRWSIHLLNCYACGSIFGIKTYDLIWPCNCLFAYPPPLQDEVSFTKWVLKTQPQINFILLFSNVQRVCLGTLLKSLVAKRFPFKFRYDHVGNGRKEWRFNLDQGMGPCSPLGIWKSLLGSK